MSEDITAQACRDGERVEAQAMHGNQSVWMAHWKHASCKSATPVCNRLGNGCEVKVEKEDHGAEPRDFLGVLGSSMHAGEVGEAARAKSVTFTNVVDNEKSKKESFGSKLFPAFKYPHKLDRRLSLQREQHDGEDGKPKTEPCSGDDNVSLNRAGTSRAGLPSISAHAHPKPETLVEECRVLSQEVLPTALLLKSPLDVEQKNLAVSTSVWNDFVKSASHIAPHGRGKGKNVMPEFTNEPREVCQSSYNFTSQEQFTCTKYHTYSSLLISEKKISSLLDPQRSSFSKWMQSGIAHLPQDFVGGSDDGLYLVHGQRHEIEKYVANPNITSKSASSGSTKPQKFYGGSSVVAHVPCAIHDVGSMKIYTSIDSAEESSRRRPKISQTTHHFLMSDKTDVNLSDRAQFFREPVAPIKFKENVFHEILDLSPPMSNHGREGLKLEAAGSSVKSEGKGNIQNLKYLPCLKNESSAETDTMDIDALHNNNLPGDGVPLLTNKDSKDSQNSLTSKVATNSAREKTKAKSVNTTVPDINQEPDELLTQESPVVDWETSTSRTHSLDLDNFLSHADKHARSNSGNSSLGSDPSSRWVKRLKLCTLGSAHGTESKKTGETSHEKVNKIFGKILNDSKTGLEPKMVPDLPATVSTDGKSSFTKEKETEDITLSHPWIKRWGHNRAASSQKKHGLGVVQDEFQKKQFPSIAAMALMGKAMNSLNPSELMKKGPVVVWNMKGF